MPALLPDRVKNAAAVAATAPLPAPLRVPARLRLLSRLQRARARRADVLLVLHPKCGGTWLRVMLFRLYQVKYGIASRRVFKTDELHRSMRSLPVFLATNGHYSYEGVVGAGFDDPRLGPELRRKKVILMARHPCDIVVSWYLQFEKRMSRRKQELINHELEQPVRRGTLDMWDFVRHRELGLPALIDYFNGWERRLAGAEHGLVIRYEDLRSDPAAVLRRIGGHVGECFSDECIEAAVDFGAFDNLKVLEREKYFRNAGLRTRGAGDPDAAKVRRGRVGGYQDYFTPAQAAWMDELVETRLSPAFGYHARSPKERGVGTPASRSGPGEGARVASRP